LALTPTSTVDPRGEEGASSDADLMAAVARGDRAAQRAVAQRMLGEVRRVASKIVRGPDLDDAVQVCLIEVLTSAGNYRGEGKLEAWAQRIVLRRAIRFWRRESRHHGALLDDEAGAEALPDTADERTAIESLPRPIEDYLAQLSEVQRMAIILRHGFGYSLAEIGELTDTDPNTVKARLLYGRRRLRALVGENLHDAGLDGGDA
jgi:RNA polymerase sigma-70 factor (ECF subfamily)